jgi:hypothetical protein
MSKRHVTGHILDHVVADLPGGAPHRREAGIDPPTSTARATQAPQHRRVLPFARVVDGAVGHGQPFAATLANVKPAFLPVAQGGLDVDSVAQSGQERLRHWL